MTEGGETELKDSVLGEKTAANGMNKSDMLDMDAFIGNNDENLAASAINDTAVGVSRIVTFESGEAERRDEKKKDLQLGL